MSNGQDSGPILEDSAWLAEDIGGSGVIDRLQSTLNFDINLNVSGNGGCNRFFGSATVNENEIVFGPLGSTRMACPPAIMDQESRYLLALDSVRTWRIDADRDLLYLDDDKGQTNLRFSRLTSPD